MKPPSEREKGVVRLLRAGFSNADIGAELRMDIGQVKYYIAKLLWKHKCKNRGSLILALEKDKK